MSAWVSEGVEMDWNIEQYWVITANKADLGVSKT